MVISKQKYLGKNKTQTQKRQMKLGHVITGRVKVHGRK